MKSEQIYSNLIFWQKNEYRKTYYGFRLIFVINFITFTYNTFGLYKEIINIISGNLNVSNEQQIQYIISVLLMLNVYCLVNDYHTFFSSAINCINNMIEISKSIFRTIT